MIEKDRRRFLGAVGTAVFSSLALPKENAFAEDELVDVYFGVGCFWHVQHEFIEAEARLLGRKGSEFTTRTGYAGGTKTEDGTVCYHNRFFLADYGKMGHGEVCGMSIPESSIGDFSKEYFAMFTKKGERVDPMDKGAEYRSLLGLPGGVKHPMYKEVEAAATTKGLQLIAGKGNDPDTLGKKSVFVMDSNKFPFYQAEVYHQFHDDFLTPPYGEAYNNLQTTAFKAGSIKEVSCPDRLPSV